MDLWIILVMRMESVPVRIMLLETNVMLVSVVFLGFQLVIAAMMITMGILIVNHVIVTWKVLFEQIANMVNVLANQILSETNVTKLNLDTTTFQIQEVCNNTISHLDCIFEINNPISECECSQEGSVAITCDDLSGKCSCKEFVIGDKCTECATEHYGFPGCQACECNPVGSENNLCNVENGHCDCKADNIGGFNCDKCAARHFGFRQCHGKI